ncbi:MAG: peroxiredoxin [Candidatus Walczuchella monophlebidarum]|uniref:peroxiredoxin n=1 Tax=Candidatus Walczuchella endosymbiont of Icerya purchasi TaxID=3066219 RepID=UPI00313EDCD5
MALLVGKKAPDFRVNAVVNGKEIVSDFTLEQFQYKKYVLLFFYPKDFTFVCPTELHAFQERLKDFESRNVQLIAISTDTEQSHWGWLQLPKSKGGIQGITYPIVADTNKYISYNYGVLAGELYVKNIHSVYTNEELIAYRGLFLIDKKGIIRHQLVNDLFLGRNVEESLRVVDALQYFERHGEVCPANWKKGKKGIKANHNSIAEYFTNNM